MKKKLLLITTLALTLNVSAQTKYDKIITVIINDFSEACSKNPGDGDAIFCLTDEHGKKTTERYSCIGGANGWEVEPKDLITDNWVLNPKYKEKKAILYCIKQMGGAGWVVKKVEFSKNEKTNIPITNNLKNPEINDYYRNKGIKPADIIGNPIQLNDLKIAEHDVLPGSQAFQLNWGDAKEACEKLGDGWRLPTKEELNEMYKNKDKIGGFSNHYYWSSKEDNFHAWSQYFENGNQEDGFKDDQNTRTRAVWTTPPSEKAKEDALVNNKLSQNGRVKPADIIGKPNKLGNLEITEYPLTSNPGVDYEYAKKACAWLGDGWRLPTKEELNDIFAFQTHINPSSPQSSSLGMTENCYWSSTEEGTNGVWCQNFQDLRLYLKGDNKHNVGEQFINDKNHLASVHAVRTYSADRKSPIDLGIIGNPFKLGDILIAEKIFPNVYNWENAKIACAKLGDGWRLPTKEELNQMYINKDKIGGFPQNSYWSSTERGVSHPEMTGNKDDYAWLQNFQGGSQITQSKGMACTIRAVKDSNSEKKKKKIGFGDVLNSITK